MSSTHAMMPEPSHDERAEQYFIRDLKIHLLELGAIEEKTARGLMAQSGQTNVDALREQMMASDVYRSWIGYRRLSQEMLWDAISGSVDRQIDTLTERGRIESPAGSLRLDPDFVPPAYLGQVDVHLMPGGYAADLGDGDVRQGAIMDRGGAVYLLGRNGGLMNDGRGHAMASHVFDRAPDFAPQRTLELGCGVGASTVAVASYFPEAENWGLDVGAAMLRYAHARAEHIGAKIHFAQGDAEATHFPDDHFDLVYTCAVLHETSEQAVKAIIAEARRILRPGGMMVHLEVPTRYDGIDPWGRLQGDFEAIYNNESYWHGANSLDYARAVEAAGFGDVMVGYQATRPRAERGNKGFSETSSGVFACWFVVSGVK